MAIGWKLHGDGRHSGAGRGGQARTSGSPGARTAGHRRPARRRDVRRDVRLPGRDGARPEPRDHDVGRRDDPVPADREREGAELSRAPARRSSARSPRSAPAGGSTANVTGAILVAGLVLARGRVVIHFLGAGIIHRIFPPVVTGAVVMLIGFNLAPVVAERLLAAGPVGRARHAAPSWCCARCCCAASGPGSPSCSAWSSGTRCRGSWTRPPAQITALDAATGQDRRTHHRVNFDGGRRRPTGSGCPHLHAPDFKISAILLALPAVIALIAENTGHVKAVAEMTETDLDPYLGRAVVADGVGHGRWPARSAARRRRRTPRTSASWPRRGSTRPPPTTWPRSWRSCSGCARSSARWSPATPGGVLGGITVILYGMIGLLGAKIWIENRVDFGDPVNLVPVAAGIILAIGNVNLQDHQGLPAAGHRPRHDRRAGRLPPAGRRPEDPERRRRRRHRAGRVRRRRAIPTGAGGRRVTQESRS